MSLKFVPPSTKLTAFNCPHCQVLTSQRWHYVYVSLPKDAHLPDLYTIEIVSKSLEDDNTPDNIKNILYVFRDYVLSNKPMIDGFNNYSNTSFHSLNAVRGLDISNCTECKCPSIWLYGIMIYPNALPGVFPNQDLPDEIRADMEEARSIINLSPRGAAALLRLSIQKLCKHLGGKGKNINEDIGILVKNGIDELIQQSLDIVRVIGNEAVHPGQIDLRDDRDTAIRLLQVINIIAEKCITLPKQISDLYNSLPSEKLKEIKERNKKSLPPP